MSKPVATAVFAGPYGGEVTAAITRRGAQWVAKPQGYVAKAFADVEAAKRYMARAHGFVRWA